MFGRRNIAITRNDQMIKGYFDLGLAGPEIVLFLVGVHGIGISLRQVKQVLARMECTRRRRRSRLAKVAFISVINMQNLSPQFCVSDRYDADVLYAPIARVLFSLV